MLRGLQVLGHGEGKRQKAKRDGGSKEIGRTGGLEHQNAGQTKMNRCDKKQKGKGS